MAKMKCKECKCEYGNFMGLDVDEAYPIPKKKKEMKMGLCPDCSAKKDIDNIYKWSPFGTDLRKGNL